VSLWLNDPVVEANTPGLTKIKLEREMPSMKSSDAFQTNPGCELMHKAKIPPQKLAVPRIRTMLVCLTSSVLAALVGYVSGALHQDAVALLLAQQTPGIDYLSRTCSFSEVDSAKAYLEGVSNRWLIELRQRRYAAGLLPGNRKRPNQQHSEQAINDLLGAIDEFQGTGQEFAFVEDLLAFLNGQEQRNRWVEVYTRLLYQHPTDFRTGALAQRAVAMARAVGREEDVLRAFQHLSDIPLDFGTKEQVSALLGKGRAQGGLALDQPPASLASSEPAAK
jgi:hypothetical protein